MMTVIRTVQFLIIATMAFGSLASDVYAWEPNWKLEVKLKGKKGTKVYYPDADEISILGVGRSRCTLSKPETATGSASRVIECKRGSVRRSATLGFDRKIHSTKKYEVYFSTKEVGEPDLIFQLTCCQKTS